MNQKDTAEVLFANERFYAAFAEGDVAAMEELWGEEGSVICIHPGWEPLESRENIIASWKAIFQAPPPVSCVSPKLLPLGSDGAGIVCWEEINGDFLIATNLYRKEAGVWRIVHHQAGPVRGGPPAEEDGGDLRQIN